MKLLFSMLIALSTTFSSARTLAVVTKTYEEKISEISTEKSAAITKLRNGYLKRLSLVKKEIQGSGNLEKVELADTEIQKIQSETWPLNPLTVNTPSNLKKARKLYTEARFKIENKSAISTVKLVDTMLVFLEKRKIEATKSGKLGEAKAARALLKELETDEVISAVRKIAKQGSLDSKGVPVLRLRRYGDDLEVIVFYDAQGKVSLKSPIENTIEETDGREERGDTPARTLGEFIGAEGFEPAPYVALNQFFTKKDSVAEAAGMHFAQKMGDQVEGQSGLRLTLVEKPSNPFYAIANIFPPASSPGTYRVSCTYFIPAENRNLEGFSLYQGGAVRIGNHVFDKKDQWISKTVEGTSYNKETILRLYPKFRAGQSMVSASGESLVIQHLKVEHTRFSAWIHTRFNEDGESTESNPQSGQQKLFVSNGKILPN